MPALTTAAILGGIGLASGGLSAFGKSNPQFNMGTQSALGAAGGSAALGALGSMGQYAGPFDFSRSNNAANDLASLFGQYQATGGVPTAGDQSAASTYAQSQFDPQRVAMAQAFQDQVYKANQQAALSGRGTNDPILRAKLATEQTRQQAQLTAQQGAFGSNYAQQISQNRLGYAEGRANVLTQNDQLQAGAKQQAFNNYSNIFNMGQNAETADFSQRYQQAYGQFLQQKEATSTAERLGSTINSGLSAFGSGMKLGGIGNYQGNYGGGSGSNPFSGGGSNPFSFGGGSSYGSQPTLGNFKF